MVSPGSRVPWGILQAVSVTPWAHIADALVEAALRDVERHQKSARRNKRNRKNVAASNGSFSNETFGSRH